MRPLSAAQIVGVWERGISQHPVDRALTLLAAGRPQSTPEQLAALGVGQRDAGLFDMRERLFGPTIEASARCPRCTQALEFTLRTSDLVADPGPGVDEPKELVAHGMVVKFRGPNTGDLRAIAPCSDVERARSLLIQRCVLEARRDGVPVATEALPEPVVARLATLLEESDPLADVALDLQCPECGHAWPLTFDVATFFWEEIEALARRLMLEVHTLARAYGWSEGEILALGAVRRRLYVEMAG
jgi:hypothetical protein